MLSTKAGVRHTIRDLSNVFSTSDNYRDVEKAIESVVTVTRDACVPPNSSPHMPCALPPLTL
jgi:hypothetical protein